MQKLEGWSYRMVKAA